jgi:hypothetical protein
LRVCLETSESGDKVGPDLQALVKTEIIEVKGELDTRLESFVEGPDSVAGQDEDS